MGERAASSAFLVALSAAVEGSAIEDAVALSSAFGGDTASARDTRSLIKRVAV
jgi:hypothetical protein